MHGDVDERVNDCIVYECFQVPGAGFNVAMKHQVDVDVPNVGFDIEICPSCIQGCLKALDFFFFFWQAQAS